MVNVKQDGTIYAVKDTSERTGKKVTGNDMIEILALQDGKIIGYWHDCNWSRNGGISSVLWSLPVSLDVSAKRELKQWKRSKKRKQDQRRRNYYNNCRKIVPVTPTHSSVSPVETGKVHPSVNPTEVVIGTDAPGKRVEETTVATAPIAPATTAAETTAEEIKIVPLS